MSQKERPNYTFALCIVIAVCFLIGFVTTMNNSMIEFCKNAFDLNNQQSQYVNSAFYGAYIMSIPFGLMMSKIGYKSTLILGLAVVGLGFIINWWGISSNIGNDVSTIYWIFLGSMSIVALGVVMLQLVANPYVMVLGSPDSGKSVLLPLVFPSRDRAEKSRRMSSVRNHPGGDPQPRKIRLQRMLRHLCRSFGSDSLRGERISRQKRRKIRGVLRPRLTAGSRDRFRTEQMEGCAEKSHCCRGLRKRRRFAG